MKKIVINRSWGDFDLSEKAMQILRDKDSKWAKPNILYNPRIRDDPLLVRVIEVLGRDANNDNFLQIVEIPDGVEWMICGYDGMEWVAEKHRFWSAPDVTGDDSIRRHS